MSVLKTGGKFLIGACLKGFCFVETLKQCQWLENSGCEGVFPFKPKGFKRIFYVRKSKTHGTVLGIFQKTSFSAKVQKIKEAI